MEQSLCKESIIARRKEYGMNVFHKIIAFLKKIGVLKVGGEVRTYKSSKDAGYQPPDPLEN